MSKMAKEVFNMRNKWGCSYNQFVIDNPAVKRNALVSVLMITQDIGWWMEFTINTVRTMVGP